MYTKGKPKIELKNRYREERDLKRTLKEFCASITQKNSEPYFPLSNLNNQSQTNVRFGPIFLGVEDILTIKLKVRVLN
jgi:hypothetical protein